MSLFDLDDHYSELTYNGPKAPQIDWGAKTLRRAFFWPHWYATGPWRNMKRNEWFIGEKR